MTTRWHPGDPLPEISGNDAHVWLRPIDRTVAPEVTDLLSAEERDRAARYKVEAPRRQFICARATLRWLLGRYLDLNPRAIEFSFTKHGKPSLAGGGGLQFNVSHTGEMAALAFANGPVGIDIEKHDREVEVDALSKRFFSGDEHAQLSAMNPTERREAFFRCWTQKEAYLKALGSGLSRDTRTFTVDCEEGSPGLVEDIRDATAHKRWAITKVPSDHDYCLSLAVAAPAGGIRVFRMDRFNAAA